MLDFDACPVPGSYAANVRATVKTLNGETKRFSVLYAKRYDREQLDCQDVQGRLGSRRTLALCRRSASALAAAVPARQTKL